jgi:hypothetical protein
MKKRNLLLAVIAGLGVFAGSLAFTVSPATQQVQAQTPVHGGDLLFCECLDISNKDERNFMRADCDIQASTEHYKMGTLRPANPSDDVIGVKCLACVKPEQLMLCVGRGPQCEIDGDTECCTDADCNDDAECTEDICKNGVCNNPWIVCENGEETWPCDPDWICRGAR